MWYIKHENSVIIALKHIANTQIVTNEFPNTTWPATAVWKHTLRVSCQKGSTCHAYAWQIGPFWQDTLNIKTLGIVIPALPSPLTSNVLFLLKKFPPLFSLHSDSAHTTTVNASFISRPGLMLIWTGLGCFDLLTRLESWSKNHNTDWS